MKRVYEDEKLNALMLNADDIIESINNFYDGMDWRESVYNLYREQFKESIDISKVWVYYDKK